MLMLGVGEANAGLADIPSTETRSLEHAVCPSRLVRWRTLRKSKSTDKNRRRFVQLQKRSSHPT
jgi:hypothetical protein